MALIQSTGKAGKVSLTAKADGVKEAKLTLEAEPADPRPFLA